MPRPSHVSPRPLHEQLVRVLCERVVAADYPPGSLLPSEAEIAQEHGISRSVVREALRVLAEKGLIEVLHGRGSRVREPEHWDFFDAVVINARRERGAMYDVIRELLEARKVVECEVAALAATRRSNADLERMEEALATMRASIDVPERYAEADFAFHRVLLEASGNRVLIRMAEPIRQLLEYSLHTTDCAAHLLERALHDHEMIERAVRRRNAEHARAAMRKHLERTERDVEAFARAAEQPA